MFNNRNGKVSAKLAYDLIYDCSTPYRPDRTLIQIWQCNIPLNIICFNWLCLSNRINTWDNLNKKRWIGPNWCCLCNFSNKTISHICIDCIFTLEVIQTLGIALLHPFPWKEDSYLQNLELWFRKEKFMTYLTLLMCWQLWLTRNRYIF